MAGFLGAVPAFVGGLAQASTMAANSAAPYIASIDIASKWAAYAGEGASLLSGGGSSAAAAGGAVAEAGAAASAGSAAASAGGAAGGAAAGGGGALAALGPVAAVVGSGLAGLAAGWGMAEGIDSHKGGLFGQDEWGNTMSFFDATAAIGRDTDKAVERGLGGGLIESVIGAGGVDTIGDVAGAGMTAATSIVGSPLGIADSLYSFFAD